MQTIPTSPVVVRGDQPLPWEFELTLRHGRSGPALKRFHLDSSELGDLGTGMWRDGFLRRGLPDFPLEQVSLACELLMDPAGGRRCVGLTLEACNPRGERIRREFGLEIFRDVALQAASDLVSERRLESTSLVYYEVAVAAGSRDSDGAGGSGLVVESRRAPLEVLRVRLQDLFADARVLGPLSEGEFPVLYTEHALEKAERFSRKGARATPPVETGGVLLGWICSCPESGELFVVVHDALEAVDADRAVFSLSYTGRTWNRIQAILQARQGNPATRYTRILGQCHGHNQTPEPQCPACTKRDQCERHNCAASSDDLVWSRAVFHRQPWQLCHIFGLDARGGHLQGLFTLKDNRLRERGFHVLPRFRVPDSPAAAGEGLQTEIPGTRTEAGATQNTDPDSSPPCQGAS